MTSDAPTVEQPELPFPPTSALRRRLVEVQEEVEALEEEVPGAASPCGCTGTSVPDVAELARTVLACKAVIGAARDLQGQLELALIDAMPERQMVSDGMVLEKKSGTIRKSWDNPAVASKVSALACVDQETGEVFGSPVFAQRVTDEILATAGIGYWRVSALRNRGIDPGRYCEEEQGKPSVIIRTSA
jgi:hypothetical protein